MAGRKKLSVAVRYVNPDGSRIAETTLAVDASGVYAEKLAAKLAAEGVNGWYVDPVRGWAERTAREGWLPAQRTIHVWDPAVGPLPKPVIAGVNG